MNDEHRDRAAGWKHAKHSGHLNEENIKNFLEANKRNLTDLLDRIKYENEVAILVSVGGLHEKDVMGVLDKKTKSKTDLKIICESGKSINISIKKSLGGQVYFVGVQSFINVFEKQFNRIIPSNIQNALKLFWADDKNAINIIKECADRSNQKTYDMQIRHKSLNADTLKKYDGSLYESMLSWFKENIYELSKLSFASGAVLDKSEWSEFIWYKNTLGENTIDEIFHIDELCQKARRNANSETYYGSENGGTTIQLPFGFVQWHQKKMQFHHNFEKIKKLFEE